MMPKTNHWTDTDEKFQFRIAMDFIGQIEKKMESGGITQKRLAKRLGVSFGRISQVLNNPGNLNLKSIVKTARGLGMKVAIVAYDDLDPTNNFGPINSEIFEAS